MSRAFLQIDLRIASRSHQIGDHKTVNLVKVIDGIALIHGIALILELVKLPLEKLL